MSLIFAAVFCTASGYCQLHGEIHLAQGGPDAMVETPFTSLESCQRYIRAASSGGTPDAAGRIYVGGRQYWWECRSKRVDDWEEAQ